MVVEWFDTHAHLSYEGLVENVSNYLETARTAGLVGVLSVGTHVESSLTCVELSERHPSVWAAVGIHPNDTANATPEDWQVILELSRRSRVVAIGETGLDKHWDDSPFETQVDWFLKHLQLGRELDRPVVIHTRDCEPDMVATLSDFSCGSPIKGIMHSFCGDWSTARCCLDLGLHISFAGMSTYKNAESIREVAAKVPLDRILVETDAPFLTPHPHRGQRPNHPAMVVHTGRHLAGYRKLSEGDFAAQTTENARRLFGIPV